MRFLLFLVLGLTLFGFGITNSTLEELGEVVVENGNTPTSSNTQSQVQQRKAPQEVFGRLYFIGNLSYNETDTNSPSPFLKAGNINTRSASLSVNGELLWKPLTTFTFKVDGLASLSTDYPTNTSLFVKGANDQLVLNELLIENYFGEHVSLLVGKYRKVFGPGLFANPMDRYTPSSSLPGQVVVREGSWQGNLAFHFSLNAFLLNDMNFELLWLPQFYRSVNGLPLLEDTVKSLTPLFKVSEKSTNWTTGNMGYAFHWYGNFLKGDLNLMAYYIDEQPQLGLSYAKPLGEILEVHGEALYYERSHRTMTNTNNYWNALVGFRLEPTSDIGMTVEYLHQGDRLEEMPQSNSERISFYSSRLFPSMIKGNALFPFMDELAVSVYWRNIKDVLDLTFNSIMALKVTEASFTLRLDYRIGQNSRVSLIGNTFSGPSDGFYRLTSPFLWRVNAELYIGI